MPNTSSVLLIAILAFAGSVPAQSQQPAPTPSKAIQQPEPQAGKREDSAAHRQRVTPSPPPAHGPIPTPAAEPQPSENREQRRDYTSAEWWLVYLSFFLVIVTLGLAIYTANLWRATKTLAQDAETASERTIETMERTERRSLRAYVGVESLRFECLNIDDPDYVPDFTTAGVRHGDFIVVTVGNFGQTPARDVSVFAYLVSTEGATRLPESFFATHDADFTPHENVRRTLARFQLFPGQSEASKSATDVRGVRLGKAGTHTLYVYGRLYYRDIYGRPWRTKFCYSWEPDHPHGERFVPYEEYNGQDQQELAPPPQPAPPQPGQEQAPSA